MADTVRTTCPYCGVGCGILATREADGTISVKGDPDHPANFGRLCSKGAALGETLGEEGRLLHPMIGEKRVSWDIATETIARRLKDVIAKHGPEAVAFYVSGQLLTEDYYVANKLMKGFIGAANIDTNSRLCMSSSVAGHVRAFGSDTVPGCYEDLELADLVVLVGSNTAWCHPVLYQRLRAAKEQRGTKVVVIDPRRTETCGIADLHLALLPGTDVTLFNGLLAYLEEAGAGDDGFVAEHTTGFGKALETARQDAPSIVTVAATCGLALADLERFYHWVAETPRTVTVYSQGVNQSVQGTDKVNAILNTHLYTGRIGKPGSSPFSVTGQPNAMGGREVGGLANMLAAHMGFAPDAVERVRDFWGSPAIVPQPGLKAVDLFEAVHEGRIKALWIMATNPAVSLPDTNRVRAALENCDFVVVSDCVNDTDTLRHAHVRLPATTWGERNGMVTNSERRLSRQRPFLEAPGEARPDWRIITDVARAMGHGEAFPYQSSHEIFDEHARLSALDNDGSRDFDLGGLVGLDRNSYDGLEPVQWPVVADPEDGTTRMFADGRFFTADGRAHFIAVSTRLPARRPDRDYPFVLNSGRVRDHWHTMTRSGRSPRLARHRSEPFVEVHPETASGLGLEDGGWALVETPLGEVLLRVRQSRDVAPDALFVPIHWNDTVASKAGIGRLVSPQTDPVSGQPGLKFTPANLRAWVPSWSGFLLTRETPENLPADYWSRATVGDCRLYEVADAHPLADPAAYAEAVLGGIEGELVSVEDPRQGDFRWAVVRDGRLVACLLISGRHRLPPRDWLIEQFTRETMTERDRAGLLSGRPSEPAEDSGATVCSCFGVGLKTILGAIESQGLTSVAAIGEALQAGTNCGSCLPELEGILSDMQATPARTEAA